MNFTSALTEARSGKRIRRENWENSLRININGDLEFVIAVQMFGKTRGRAYRASKIDKAASDWLAL